ncbi:hypothetical protein J5N97_023825 [Dioscorea zingiberensis]|uniref:Uncharacterized protein n=1 Tax=Dioscorea zingiberensis TaxID=325984 RepID=A0A9D5C5U7_9LILI|nr:hypothetical protein J5N97_023825 [Dioscorea zingiberensis]
MISTKRLVEMVRRWQKATALRRRRISSTRINQQSTRSHTSSCSLAIASKGHIFIYTTDEKRFMIPLSYLRSSIFMQLLRMSEEEFGLPRDGPITLPCDSSCMESVISFLKSRTSKEDKERALLASIANRRCDNYSSYFVAQQECSQTQLILYGF